MTAPEAVRYIFEAIEEVIAAVGEDGCYELGAHPGLRQGSMDQELLARNCE